MAIPAGVEQVTITDGGVALTGPDGTPLEGSFVVTGPDLATVREDDFLFSGLARRWVTAGRFDPLTLVATDATDIDPTGFSYTVVFTPKRGTAWTRYFTLPKASPSVVLADVLIPDPVAGTPTSGPGTGTPTGSAGGDLSGAYPNPTVAKVNGVTVTGTPTTGQVPTATSSTAASWQTPAAPSPASTVTTETSYGQASQTGTASAYARGDHSHGTPALPSPAAIGAETAGTATTAVSAHTAASDPHSDRAYADSQVATRAPTSRLITAGTGLTGGGSLAADRTLAVAYGATAGTAAEGNDSRLSNARTPTAHASTHASGGSDPLTPAAIGALPSSGGSLSGSLAVAGNALGMDTPAIHRSAAWCYDPALAVNSTQLTAGVLYLTRVDIAANIAATKLYWWVANTGSGATTNQNWAGLYDSAGTLLASANVDASFSSATLKTTTITATALTAGQFYWVALLFNASVTPTLTRASGWTGVDTAANLGLAAAEYRFAKNGTGRTVLPSPLVPASNIGTDFAGPWVAVGA